MALDRIKIGARIRKIRDEIYQETRAVFAERCGFTENYLGKLERGEASISTKTLDKICSAVGTTPNYILYGDSTNKNLSIRNTIDNFLDNSSKDELKMFFKFVSIIKETKK